jgi:branched-chain amino acid transport system ATP-binding protein
LVENVALAAYASQNGEIDRSEAERRGIEALTLVGLPTDREATTDGMGAAALKKLELAKAISTDPKVLLADESLGGLDTDEMRQAADLLRMLRDEKGLAIVWVEHVLGVLMSVIDRIIVLDHGETIFEGAPFDATRDPKVVEIYLGPGAENLRRA